MALARIAGRDEASIATAASSAATAAITMASFGRTAVTWLVRMRANSSIPPTPIAMPIAATRSTENSTSPMICPRTLPARLGRPSPAVRLAKRQRLQDHGVHQAEDCGAGSDTERECQHDDGRKAGLLADRAQGEAEVLSKPIHRPRPRDPALHARSRTGAIDRRSRLVASDGWTSCGGNS